MKYKDWLVQWLTYYVKPRTKQRTYEKYCIQTKRHIIPDLGHYEMEDLTAIRLQQFVVLLSEKGLSGNTQNGVISVVKQSLKNAVIFNVVEKEYSDRIKRSKKIERQIGCFTKEEQRKIEEFALTSAKSKMRGIVIALYSGLRIGELLALQWADVDLKKGEISVNKSCYDSWENGRYVKKIEEPKTQNSVRVIPIPKQLVPIFKELKRKKAFDYVISNQCSHGVQIRSYQRTFESVLKKINVPHRGFHSLRHTFATRALECGMDVKTLSEILGHSDPNITLRRYAHSLSEHKKQMMDRVGKLLK